MTIPTATNKACEEIIDFIVSGKNPGQIISFQASDTVKNRVANLIEREKNKGITPEEKAELDIYIQLEHLIRLAKARAYQFINQ